MSTPSARERAPGLAARVRAGWRELFGEQRLAAIAAIALIASMFLPWYQQTGFVTTDGRAEKIDESLIAFEAWSFVEASILLVALAVLALVVARGERRAFHLPFGDGPVLLAAGAWVMFLVFYRQIDKPEGSDAGALKTTVGVSWGIFVAFLLGALLAYAGWRMATRRRPEPVVDGDDPRTAALEGDPLSVAPPDEATAVAVAAAEEAREIRAHDERPTSAIPPEERPTASLRPEEPPTAPIPPDERPTRRLERPLPPARRRAGRRDDGQSGGQLSFDDD